MENPIRMEDLGGKPLFLETPIKPTGMKSISQSKKIDVIVPDAPWDWNIYLHLPIDLSQM